MTLEKTDVVDATGIDKESGQVVLSILDWWDWEDELGHLTALQSKLNSYFDFVESGQVLEMYPEALGKPVRINLISRYPVPDRCVSLLVAAKDIAAELQISISQCTHFGVGEPGQ